MNSRKVQENFPSLGDFVEKAKSGKIPQLVEKNAIPKEICLRPKPTVNINAQSGNWVIDAEDVTFVRDLAAGNFGEVKLCELCNLPFHNYATSKSVIRRC